jgi:hypothetical protein
MFAFPDRENLCRGQKSELLDNTKADLSTSIRACGSECPHEALGMGGIGPLEHVFTSLVWLSRSAVVYSLGDRARAKLAGSAVQIRRRAHQLSRP